MTRKIAVLTLIALCVSARPALPQSQATLNLPKDEYIDRVHAAWMGQVLGMLMGYQFEHKQGAVAPVDRLPEIFRGQRLDFVPLDDDWYYEIVALRAFEKHGIGLTVRQLGEQWLENKAGFWSCSREALRLLERGIQAPDTGHPRYNRSWFTIGAQFSAEIYGMVAPGMPNLAARLGREMGHVQGYAEAADGSAFVAGLLSLAFAENDPKQVVRQAARLIDPSSPYRQALDQTIAMAERGRPYGEIAREIQDRWGVEYQTTNSAVINGAITALAVWFGEGDFSRSVNVALQAADFTDADCNAATAAAVVGVMHGMRALPQKLVAQFNDRVRGDELAGIRITPPLDESMSGLARRTAAIGEKFVVANGGAVDGRVLRIRRQSPVALPPELFRVSDLMRYWNPAWELIGAGLGNEGDELRLSRGSTYLDGDVLVTFPRDEIRGVMLRRTLRLSGTPKLYLEVSAEAGKAWHLEIFAGNDRILSQRIVGAKGERAWQQIQVGLEQYAGQDLQLRIYQRTLVFGRLPSKAFWRKIEVQ
ncbi:MAG TPA: ADP-ribosylglycohydrolase family protein [Bryobacteraceae bacterium]|nr:ADP-ribosylglycohydrolase family protein [Bryobacteraceae bacterium]HOQ44776.1 ADP-ribosylglycohydrolase family protein [Bryobacteraceae bacterium]HPQ14041.1 ADP-ribosylglycohydrolase family protein [Bryobacteraceae bacterium]HPU71986.1 ADP-ribosylglycohydrolase family protein [Bryobacteraceae bacterium]